MLYYFFQVSFTWAILLGLYWLFLRKETFFLLNRWYLLGSIIGGLCLPALSGFFNLIPGLAASAPAQYLQPITIGVASVEATLGTVSLEAPQTSMWPAFIAKMLFILVALFVFSRVLSGLWAIRSLIKHGQVEPHYRFWLVRTGANHTPFSFLRYLFLSTHKPLSPSDESDIIAHETAHIQGWHSADVLFLEVLKIFFWWNPLWYIFKRELSAVHEYLADAAVLRNRPVKQYGHLLLRQSVSGNALALGNPFHSQLKKRILMMTKKRSQTRALWKYLPVFPLLILLTLLFAGNSWPTMSASASDTETISASSFDPVAIKNHFKTILNKRFTAGYTDADLNQDMVLAYIDYRRSYPEHEDELQAIVKELAMSYKAKAVFDGEFLAKILFQKPNPAYDKVASNGKGLYTKASQMPVFAGCVEGDAQAKAACSKKALFTFILDNLKYPEAAKAKNAEGRAVISFIIDINGKVVEAEIVEDPGYGMGKEALRVVQSFPTWTPGRNDGESVAVQLNLPFVFKLPAEKKAKPSGKVDQMAAFPGCLEKPNLEEKKKCSFEHLIEYISENLEYPSKLKADNLEGKVVASFVITKLGKVGDIEIIKSLSPEADAAVKTVLKGMNEMEESWEPALLAGKPVASTLTLPFSFINEREDQTKNPLVLEGFKMIPNPSSGQVRLSFKGEKGDLVLDIVDLSGKQVFQEVYPGFNGHFNKTLQLNNQTAGTYMVRILQGDKVFTEKLVLK